ncbi:hypothetical protein BDY24DRAFT_400337 [Mrakia frigida]|uniref:uncharacterized protein n=1 Tax=Mrakia frigida TaxID=29902 RepID=UPI003FCC042E
MLEPRRRVVVVFLPSLLPPGPSIASSSSSLVTKPLPSSSPQHRSCISPIILPLDLLLHRQDASGTFDGTLEEVRLPTSEERCPTRIEWRSEEG